MQQPSDSLCVLGQDTVRGLPARRTVYEGDAELPTAGKCDKRESRAAARITEYHNKYRGKSACVLVNL